MRAQVLARGLPASSYMPLPVVPGLAVLGGFGSRGARGGAPRAVAPRRAAAAQWRDAVSRSWRRFYSLENTSRVLAADEGCQHLVCIGFWFQRSTRFTKVLELSA